MGVCVCPTQDLTVEQFVERFERPRLPVVITGITDTWPASQHCTNEGLVQRYGDHKFKVRVLRHTHTHTHTHAHTHIQTVMLDHNWLA